jgi:DNA processing protein
MTSSPASLCAWLALCSLPGVGRVTIKRLLDRFRTPERIFAAGARELQQVEPIPSAALERLCSGSALEEAGQVGETLRARGIALLTLEDARYPANLRAIPDPPFLLYMEGEIQPEDQRAVAIVGTRQATPYGRQVTEKLSRELAERGVTVVSGMARGIDTAGHWGALRGEGRTLAVLGCGIDVVYPPENRALREAISKRGALLTEFPVGSAPIPGNFPQRNRIISGLALGVVIVEATADSGSLITAAAALEQGREVFAVPGNITSPRSQGANRLLKQGAKLVERVEDILEDLAPQLGGIPPARRRTQETLPLTETEARLCALLTTESRHIDWILTESRLLPQEVSALLLQLELKGAVRQLPGKWYQMVG